MISCMLYDDKELSSTSVNNDTEGPTAPIFELPTKDCTPTNCNESGVKIFKQRKVKGRRKKVRINIFYFPL